MKYDVNCVKRGLQRERTHLLIEANTSREAKNIARQHPDVLYAQAARPLPTSNVKQMVRVTFTVMTEVSAQMIPFPEQIKEDIINDMWEGDVEYTFRVTKLR
jgi:hypothetical protein